MTGTDLRRRVEKLEAQIRSLPPPRAPNPLTKLLQVLVCYHLGRPSPNASLASGLARALGYEKDRDLRDGLRAPHGSSDGQELNERWRAALDRLFVLRNTTPDSNEQAFAGAITSLFRAMPEAYQRHPFLAEIDTASLTSPEMTEAEWEARHVTEG